jgi:hypothetical protein
MQRLQPVGPVDPYGRVTRLQPHGPGQHLNGSIEIAVPGLGNRRLVESVCLGARRRCRSGHHADGGGADKKSPYAGSHPPRHGGLEVPAHRPHGMACSAGEPLERETGFEPATPSLEGSRSSQLSYSRVTRIARASALVIRRATPHRGLCASHLCRASTPHASARTGWWGEEDLNLRRHEPTDLQSAPFGRLGISPGFRGVSPETCVHIAIEARYGGAGGGNRTPDPLITNQLLYLLSYASRQSDSIFKQIALCKYFLRLPSERRATPPSSSKGGAFYPQDRTPVNPDRRITAASAGRR